MPHAHLPLPACPSPLGPSPAPRRHAGTRSRMASLTDSFFATGRNPAFRARIMRVLARAELNLEVGS